MATIQVPCTVESRVSRATAGSKRNDQSGTAGWERAHDDRPSPDEGERVSRSTTGSDRRTCPRVSGDGSRRFR